MRQRIKLTRTILHNTSTQTDQILDYKVNEATIAGSGGKYSLITEDALLIGWSTEAAEGNQYVVGIVLLSDKHVITLQVNSIQFV